MSSIDSINLIISLENKISTTNKTKKKKPTIQCKRWMFANIIELYLHNILKKFQYLLTK